VCLLLHMHPARGQGCALGDEGCSWHAFLWLGGWGGWTCGNPDCDADSCDWACFVDGAIVFVRLALRYPCEQALSVQGQQGMQSAPS
jgi:hypothetical protein